MPFQGLESVLRQIERQYRSPAQRHWRLVVELWPQVVGAQLAQQTKPENIRSQVLLVAVANPVIVQTLMFERSRLLKRLNQQLAARQVEQLAETTIIDLRFSTRGWHQPKTLESPYNQFGRWEQHPCRVASKSTAAKPIQTSLFRDPTNVFQQWADHMRDQHQAFPLCPNCAGPALAGELERWGQCSLCYAQSHAPQPQGHSATEKSD